MDVIITVHSIYTFVRPALKMTHMTQISTLTPPFNLFLSDNAGGWKQSYCSNAGHSVSPAMNNLKDFIFNQHLLRALVRKPCSETDM